MKTIQAIKCLPIRAYLAQRGLHPTKDNPRYGLYLSPLRGEHTPSFKVDYTQNLWYDFGLGAGGSIIDLVMRLERCDFTQAVRLLGSGEKIRIVTPVPSSVSPTVLAFRIVSDVPLRHAVLLDYYSGAVSLRILLARIVGRYAMRSMAENTSPSDFRMIPAAGSYARNVSRVVRRPSRLRRSTAAPIRQSHSRVSWIFSPTFR